MDFVEADVECYCVEDRIKTFLKVILTSGISGLFTFLIF
jgi:hypothetical protein